MYECGIHHNTTYHNLKSSEESINIANDGAPHFKEVIFIYDSVVSHFALSS